MKAHFQASIRLLTLRPALSAKSIFKTEVSPQNPEFSSNSQINNLNRLNVPPVMNTEESKNPHWNAFRPPFWFLRNARRPGQEFWSVGALAASAQSYRRNFGGKLTVWEIRSEKVGNTSLSTNLQIYKSNFRPYRTVQTQSNITHFLCYICYTTYTYVHMVPQLAWTQRSGMMQAIWRKLQTFEFRHFETTL